MIGVVDFCRRKGGREGCVNIIGCATRRGVVGIKYRICFVKKARAARMFFLYGGGPGGRERGGGGGARTKWRDEGSDVGDGVGRLHG